MNWLKSHPIFPNLLNQLNSEFIEQATTVENAKDRNKSPARKTAM